VAVADGFDLLPLRGLGVKPVQGSPLTLVLGVSEATPPLDYIETNQIFGTKKALFLLKTFKNHIFLCNLK
jgi:hypothetical protein